MEGETKQEGAKRKRGKERKENREKEKNKEFPDNPWEKTKIGNRLNFRFEVFWSEECDSHINLNMNN